MRFLVGLLKKSELLETTERLLSADPKDNKFLELALCGKAACIISGDEDLLVLNPFARFQLSHPENS